MKANTYRVPLSKKVKIGALTLGGGKTPLVQSMANTDTNNLEASVEQSKLIIKAGGKLVRFTTQGKREVESLGQIVEELRKLNINTPIVADVHFRADVADAAALVCEKVRINPGNFIEKQSTRPDFTDEEYEQGKEENRTRLLTFLEICKENNTAVRIGVNHGSLSKRIMSRYGDTPEGMVESTLEFLRVCKEVEFANVVVSLKSSNTRLMVQAVRLLVKSMLKEDLYYPVHLGVTESGDGLEGRIKSVVGIAALLQEGIGDTIRVSLTEAPENEIPVAKKITELFPKPEQLNYNPLEGLPWDPYHYKRPEVCEIRGIGGEKVPVVISKKDAYSDFQPDFLCANEKEDEISAIPTELVDDIVEISANDCPDETAKLQNKKIILLDTNGKSALEVKSWLVSYYSNGGSNPVIVRRSFVEEEEEHYILRAAGELGLLLIDGLISGVWIDNANFGNRFNNWLSFYVLQAARERTSVTDYIACPSCGRTLFDIQKVLQEVKQATSHLKGLKIAVMGCIVNGPGEMADADYGYIGAASGKVSIYKGKTPVYKNVPEDEALEKLMEVIEKNH